LLRGSRISKKGMWDMPRDENSLHAHVKPSCCVKVGEGGTPIFFMFVKMRFENEPMDAILDTKVTFMIMPIMLIGDLRVKTKEWR
jgi:hypothetical protein